MPGADREAVPHAIAVSLLWWSYPRGGPYSCWGLLLRPRSAFDQRRKATSTAGRCPPRARKNVFGTRGARRCAVAEEGISRRRMLKRVGAGAAVAWSAPVLTSLRVPAFAQSALCPNGCADILCFSEEEFICGGGGTCICTRTTENDCFCGEGVPVQL